MANYKVTKEMTATKIKNAVKIDLFNEFEIFLKEKFGEENVGMVRYGSTPKNELAFIVGAVNDEGFEYDVVATINPTVKDWKEKRTKSRTTDAFDFEQYKEDYEDYLTEKATKQAEAKAKKGTNKSKAEKEKELAEKKAELEKIQKLVKERQEKELAEKIAKAKTAEITTEITDETTEEVTTEITDEIDGDIEGEITNE
ncbi:MAG: hypothetical protein ACI4PF_04760 [Christensenellales bacterium]